MARTIRIRKDTEAYYHIVSRTNAKAFLFDEKMKWEMVKTMLSVAVFSGVKIEAHCMMDNHFHLVIKVMKPEKALTDYEIADRIRAIKKKEVAEAFLCSVMAYQAMGREDLVEAEREKWLRRMHDVSEFVKTYKETVTRIYKKDHEYVGSIWSGRFKSTLIENSGAGRDGREGQRLCVFVASDGRAGRGGPVGAGVGGEASYASTAAFGRKGVRK